MTPALVVCGVVLVAATALLLVRIVIGPTILDRTVALDTLVAVLVCGLAVEAAWHRHTDTLPVILVLTLVGFVGSVTVARFVPGSDDVEAGRDPDGGSDGGSGTGSGKRRGGWL